MYSNTLRFGDINHNTIRHVMFGTLYNRKIKGTFLHLLSNRLLLRQWWRTFSYFRYSSSSSTTKTVNSVCTGLLIIPKMIQTVFARPIPLCVTRLIVKYNSMTLDATFFLFSLKKPNSHYFFWVLKPRSAITFSPSALKVRSCRGLGNSSLRQIFWTKWLFVGLLWAGTFLSTNV